MPTTVLVTGAGGGTANNVVRSLTAWDPSVITVGCHDDPFRLKASAAARNWLAPPLGHPRWPRAMRAIVARAAVDVAIPTTDADLEAVGAIRRRLGCRTFLPAPPVLALCADKLRLARHLSAHGVPVPETYAVAGLGGLPAVARRLAAHPKLWCRMRRGAGSMGATPVITADQARHWIDYWVRMRGVSARAFALAEYLPGRDFACQSLWKDGRLVLIKTVERLSYFGGTSRPSGVSSIAALARTVAAPAVADVCRRAVRALGPRVSGAFSVDLKENAAGVPCVTEINAGRFITMLNLFDAAGKHSMSATYVRLALGEVVELRDEYDVAEDYYLIRDVDTPPAVFHATEVFDGFLDARGVIHRRAGRAATGDDDGRAAQEGREEHGAPGRDPTGLEEGRQGTGEGAEGRGQRLGRQALDEGEAQEGRRVGPARGGGARRWSITGEFEGHALEALALEARRVAARYGARVTTVSRAPVARPRRARARTSSPLRRRG
ncbi:MAG: hypothetical protein ACREM3_22195 [Candidatus Rokuibacteriota bacterium]